MSVTASVGGAPDDPPVQITVTSVRAVGRLGHAEPVQYTVRVDPGTSPAYPVSALLSISSWSPVSAVDNPVTSTTVGTQSPAFAVELVVPSARLEVPAPIAVRAAPAFAAVSTDLPVAVESEMLVEVGW
jgi:hypothetical protein